MQCLSRLIGASAKSLPLSLMAVPYTVMRSGALQAVAHRVRLLPNAPRMCGLGAMLTMIGALTLVGCTLSSPVHQATASDVNDKSFVFTSGAVFHAALVNVSTTLAFSNNAANFTLSSAGRTATGTNRFGSCILTVTTSTYKTADGPQEGDVITLSTCDFDSDTNRLTVEHRNTTATSAAATTSTGTTGSNSGTPARGDTVNNLSFTFTSGEVFNTVLANVETALAFTQTSTAQNFTLRSAGGTARGTNTFGPCVLTVTSGYPAGKGPQVGDVITLSPCNFDSTAKTLTVTHGTITITSAAGQLGTAP